jgi:hypothetical protein
VSPKDYKVPSVIA